MAGYLPSRARGHADARASARSARSSRRDTDPRASPIFLRISRTVPFAGLRIRVTDFCCAGRWDPERLTWSLRSLMRPYLDASLLALDDLGAGGLSDFERRVTLEIFDRRLNDRRPTVVTTNWELESIAEKMDDRIASRLATYACLRLGGEDRRLSVFGGDKSLVLEHAGVS
jgi:hypothetical protein